MLCVREAHSHLILWRTSTYQLSVGLVSFVGSRILGRAVEPIRVLSQNRLRRADQGTTEFRHSVSSRKVDPKFRIQLAELFPDAVADALRQ